MTKQAVLENKQINDAMKNFKITPYKKVAERLNKATRNTIKFAEDKGKKDE